MKKDNIKTQKDFEHIVNMWYRRAINLICIYNDNKETQSRRDKAFCLWLIMFLRIISIVDICKKHSVSKPPNFDKGGIIREVKINFK